MMIGRMIMNRVSYESSYIGNPKCFIGHLLDVIEIIGLLIFTIYWLKKGKMRKKNIAKSEGRNVSFIRQRVLEFPSLYSSGG